MRRTFFCRLFLLSLVSLCHTHKTTHAQTEPLTAEPLTAEPTRLPTTQPVAQFEQAREVSAPLAQVASVPQQSGQTGPPQGLIGPPFEINEVEQQFVDQILQMWENESSKIETYNSRFERWEYDPVFGPGNNTPSIKSIGQLTYSKPDKGSFKIEEVRRYQPQNAEAAPLPEDWVLQKAEVGEHWVCDGKSVYEYKHEKKQLVVQPLPPELHGKSIVDGPLPFLFGAEAEKLKRRYWIRSRQGNAATIWLEAYPRTQADAANYHHVEVMLERKTMQPKAIQVHMPNNKSRAVYMFDKPTINGKLDAIFGNLFNAPRTPFGWKRVVQDRPAGPEATPQAANPQPTATR